MIYNLLITAILIVAFFMCYKEMQNSKDEYFIYAERMKEDNNILKEDNAKYLNQIEFLRSESLESYRKGLYDGLEVKKDNILVVEPKPVKTFEELKEITENKKEFKVKEEEMKTIVDDYWK